MYRLYKSVTSMAYQCLIGSQNIYVDNKEIQSMITRKARISKGPTHFNDGSILSSGQLRLVRLSQP